MSNGVLSFLGGAAKAFNKEAEAKRAHQRRMQESEANMRNKLNYAVAESQAIYEINKYNKAKDAVEAITAAGGIDTPEGQDIAHKFWGTRDTQVLRVSKGLLPSRAKMPVPGERPKYGHWAIDEAKQEIIVDPKDPAKGLAIREGKRSMSRMSIQGQSKPSTPQPEPLDETMQVAYGKMLRPTPKVQVKESDGVFTAIIQDPTDPTKIVGKRIQVEGAEGAIEPLKTNYDAARGGYSILDADGTARFVKVDKIPKRPQDFQIIRAEAEDPETGKTVLKNFLVDTSEGKIDLKDAVEVEVTAREERKFPAKDATTAEVNRALSSLAVDAGDFSDTFNDMDTAQQKSIARRVANISVALRDDDKFRELTGNERFLEAVRRVREEELRARIRSNPNFNK